MQAKGPSSSKRHSASAVGKHLLSPRKRKRNLRPSGKLRPVQDRHHNQDERRRRGGAAPSSGRHLVGEIMDHRQLRNHNLSFVDISEMFNFSSPAYFSRYVQRYLGVSPSEFRG
ncbi:MAG: AraC family transcriptional regulator [Bacteroidales bacterium]|nr:AraC family transcriptional regulator [Bacteroidales bacterium]